FSSEITVARKHTRFGAERFSEAICKAVQSLAAFQQREGERMRQFRLKDITDQFAEAAILRAYDRGIIGPRHVLPVLQEWRSRTFEEFEPRSLWSLENAV